MDLAEIGRGGEEEFVVILELSHSTVVQSMFLVTTRNKNLR